MTQLLQHVLVTLRSGWRGHSFRAIFFCGCLLMVATYLAAGFSGRQPMTVGLDVGISCIRFIVTLMTLFWVQDVIAKDIERKNLLWVLAYPASRSVYLVGRALGVVCLALLSIMLLGGLLLLVVMQSSGGYTQGTQVNLGFPYLLTLVYLFLDIAVVAAFSVLVATLSTSSLMPLLVGAGFAVAARSVGDVLAYLTSGEAQLSAELVKSITILQWALPDLSRLDIRAACLYQAMPPQIQLVQGFTMAISYVVMLMILAGLVLNKREVS